MKLLVACECSGTVRDAFAALGWDAWSADIQPTTAPGQHFQGDVRQILHLDWDLIIAHPPCTFLCNVGQRWLRSDCSKRWNEFLAAVEFFNVFLNHSTKHICIENPIMHNFAQARVPTSTQQIQPWQFGHEAQKATNLWLKNLPKLVPTNIVSKGEFYTDPRGKRHSVFTAMATGDRQKTRSVTFSGIAKAMAEQWTKHIFP